MSIEFGAKRVQTFKKGRLEVVCGSMFSGKTEELMRRLKRAEYARQDTLAIKHAFDKRKHHTFIVSHDGREREAFPIEHAAESIATISHLAHDSIEVVGIDEVQFFPDEAVGVIVDLVERGKRVIVAGLDLDFRGEPFGIMPILLSIADEVLKLKAICVKCGKDSHHTQRVINGFPAKYDDPTVMVGASECYEARCRDCFEIDKPFNSIRTAATQQVNT